MKKPETSPETAEIRLFQSYRPLHAGRCLESANQAVEFRNNRRLLTLALVGLFLGAAVAAFADDGATGSGEQDLIGRILQWFYNAAAHLRPSTFSFLLRASLLFAVPGAFCYWSFLRGSRSLLIQWLWCLAGVLIATTIPVHAVTIAHPVFKAWVVVIAVLILVFVPGILPHFLTPTLGAQRLFRVINYLGLVVLWIINLVQH